ncbi:hypothetical protein BDV96DRAFT_642352 [Lophiotrema nucula]|uniref:RING-type domain-containing protein n=1 Tax=Lophiotrema nucula TaxID=690887 RepID=A0A6A5ZIA0_9PLEO|nr:hypothetical protein BDV96DRAFT_642352 [Lophiotrema nucula]
MTDWPITSPRCLIQALAHFCHTSGQNLFGMLVVFDNFIIGTENCCEAVGIPVSLSEHDTHIHWMTALTTANTPACYREYLDRLDVSDLERLVENNFTRLGRMRGSETYGNETIYCGPRLCWLVQCALLDMADVLESKWRPLFVEQPAPFRKDGHHIEQKEYADQGGFGPMPQMTFLLESYIRRDESGHISIDRDGVSYVFKLILTIAFDALDTFLFFSKLELGETPLTPTDHQRSFGKERAFEKYSTLISDHWSPTPVRYRRRASAYLAHGSFFDFIWYYELPSALRDGNYNMIGYRLYRIMVDVATHADINGREIIAENLPEEYDRPIELRWFRPETFGSRLKLDDYWDIYGSPNGSVSNDDEEEELWQEYGILEDVVMIPYGLSIPLSRYARPGPKVEEDVRCPICQYELTLEPYVSLLKCGHTFHGECISLWVNEQTQRVTCPNCRAVICEPRKSRPEGDDIELASEDPSPDESSWLAVERTPEEMEALNSSWRVS